MYAERTSVPVARSRDEIEKLLVKYNATGFMYGQQGNRYAIAFEMKGRRIRMLLPVPEPRTFRTKAAYEQEVRRRWRSLVLMIKAKLEAIASGVATLDQEFLPYIVLPGGQNVSEWLLPRLDEIDAESLPPLLPGPGVH